MAKKYNRKSNSEYEVDFLNIIAILLILLFLTLWEYRFIFFAILVFLLSYKLVRFFIDLDLIGKFKKPIVYYYGENSQKKLVELKAKYESDDYKIKSLSSGIYGEKRMLYSLEHANIPMYILYDLNLEFDGSKSQIDAMAITKRNIYLLESKNLKGTLIIDEDGNFVRKLNYDKMGIKSPITQNYEHLDIVKKILKKEKIKSRILPLVVLTNDDSYVNFKKGAKVFAKKVLRNDQLIKNMKREESKRHVIRGEGKVKKICDILLKYNKEIEVANEEIEVIEFNLENANSSKKLEERLRRWRKERAAFEQIPPYIIFNDETLEELLAKLPKTIKQLSQISGFGERRILKYGNEILKIIILETCELVDI